MSRFLNPYYEDLEAYVPGEQIPGIRVKLNTNENPYAPDPDTVALVNSDLVRRQRLYSDPFDVKLRETLAEYWGNGLTKENFSCTDGSDMMINLAMMCFGQDGIATPDLTYGIYRIYAILNHMNYEEVPLCEDFSLAPEDFFHKGKMIFIANPNAPTGLQLSNEQVRSILEANRDHVVVIDEAYGDFGDGSCIPLIREYDNLLVIRTFSKSYSIAGCRVGWGVGNTELMKDIERARGSMDPYSLSGISQAMAVSALKHPDYYMANVEKIKEARTFTINELRKRGFLVPDSKSNFVFAHTDRIDAADLQKELIEKGILTRHFNGKRTKDFLRISIGTMEDMEEVMKTLDEILK